MCTHVWLVACAHSLLLLQLDRQPHIAAAHLTQRTQERWPAIHNVCTVIWSGYTPGIMQRHMTCKAPLR